MSINSTLELQEIRIIKHIEFSQKQTILNMDPVLK